MTWLGILTLFSSLSLAGVAGWFSVLGFLTIYAGAPLYAVVMGITIESSKLVAISWLYRSWNSVSVALKMLMIYFIAALMIINAIGVFGFLSKAHIDQQTNISNHAPKIEQIDQRIAQEKSKITDNNLVISQLDTAVNAYVQSGNIDKSISVRRSQNPQRKALRTEIVESEKEIDKLISEKNQLLTEVKKVELEVGPLRYIAEIIYSGSDSTKMIESAVKWFTLLIVSVLDPLAVTLLVASNHSFMKKNLASQQKSSNNDADLVNDRYELADFFNEKTVSSQPNSINNDINIPNFNKIHSKTPDVPQHVEQDPWMSEPTVLSEIVGKHFVPKKVVDTPDLGITHPSVSSWINEFRRK